VRRLMRALSAFGVFAEPEIIRMPANSFQRLSEKRII
jgi:hypothetical protein